jgi:hypothetical protein
VWSEEKEKMVGRWEGEEKDAERDKWEMRRKKMR